ncbi:MAG TPA: YciI family protein [Polyangiaceae bacterium]|nr:YciI family protein [Polyangiaceae bacterium]
MFVIELIYKAELSAIDASMRAHVAWLNKHYAAGRFLLSGRQVPRTGGIILALGDSREQIEAIVREDPFVSRGLADFRVIEFRASQRAESLDALLAAGKKD